MPFRPISPQLYIQFKACLQDKGMDQKQLHLVAECFEYVFVYDNPDPTDPSTDPS